MRFSYATGFKEPRLEETFANSAFTLPNPNLKPERNRAFEAAVVQGLGGNNYVLSATYFNNLFHDKIDYSFDPATFVGRFVNVDKTFAHGAEIELQGKIRSRLLLNTAYTYTSTQILSAPLCTPANFCDPILAAGRPLLRRPKHSATGLLTYLGHKWGANLGGSFVGRRPDSDFLGSNSGTRRGGFGPGWGGGGGGFGASLALPPLPTRSSKRTKRGGGGAALGVDGRLFRRGRSFGEAGRKDGKC